MRRVTVFLACLSLLILPLLTRADQGDLVAPGVHGKKIPNQYIVIVDDGADAAAIAADVSKKHGGKVMHEYKHALKGFSLEISDEKAKALKSHPGVIDVVQDQEVSIVGPSVQAQTLPTGVNRINAENKVNVGTGIEVAILDTGIDLKHPDLKANILGSVSCVGGNALDGNGHGSHVAGTIAGIKNNIGVVGVAPGAKLWAVKVLNNSGNGSWSSVICGIDWVTARANRIKVANMSLGGGGTAGVDCNSSALRQAICRSVNAGVTYVVAAGNSGTDLQNFVPAAFPEVIAVSALADSNGAACGGGAGTSYGADDTFASFSNYATQAADLARLIGAPGVSILSTWRSGGYATISGTSMASPHVAGAAALWIKTHPGATPAQVLAGLLALAEPGNVNVNGECASGVSHTGTATHPEGVLRADTL